jgi:23S rRNA pseudouridine1911/1915/1917 synthase
MPASEHTRQAVTHYRVVKRKAGRRLLELKLETGRRHQIRVQLAEAGCPIVGDKTYEARTNPARRLALHACSLQFAHPVSGEPLSFQSPLPRELALLV